MRHVRDKNDNLLAVILYSDMEQIGTEFVTGDYYPLQLGSHVQPQGHIIPAHSHRDVTREVDGTAEVLVVTEGALEVTLYDNDRKVVSIEYLIKGDSVLLVSGGHRFRFLGEPTRLVEVKQGPYIGVDDKEWW